MGEKKISAGLTVEEYRSIIECSRAQGRRNVVIRETTSRIPRVGEVRRIVQSSIVNIATVPCVDGSVGAAGQVAFPELSSFLPIFVALEKTSTFHEFMALLNIFRKAAFVKSFFGDDNTCLPDNHLNGWEFRLLWVGEVEVVAAKVVSRMGR